MHKKGLQKPAGSETQQGATMRNPIPRSTPAFLRGAGVLALVLLGTAEVKAGEAYYMVVFGAQQIPPRAKYSHSFAVFLRAAGGGPCPEAWCLESLTISWLPQTLNIRLYTVLPEPGQNLELHATPSGPFPPGRAFRFGVPSGSSGICTSGPWPRSGPW